MSTSTHDLFDFLKRQIVIFRMNTQEFVEKVAEEGTPEELMSTNGIYRHMTNLQMQSAQTQPGHPMDFVGIIFSFLQSRFRSVKH